jgi:uncharacterized membrane protein
MAIAVAGRAACVARYADSGPTWCGTQIPDLYFAEDLVAGRLPYLDSCRSLTTPPQPCDEYPVLTMYAMRLGAAGGGVSGFFYVTAVLLSICAAIAGFVLARRTGLKALYFAAAPTLLLFGLMNWDLVGIVFMVLAVDAFLRDRDVLSGVWIGLAVAAKFFPVLLLLLFGLDRWRAGRREEATRLVAGAGAAWLVVNLPFALLAFDRWSLFFRFNARRPPDIDTAWYAICQRGFHDVPCMPTGLVNAASLVLFGAATALVWRAKASRDPEFRPWTFGFAVLALFFLTNKVYSPQYDLWLLPWFALALPNPVLFAAFAIAEVPVFLTRYQDVLAPPGLGFQVAVLIRDLVLVACVVAYVRGRGATLAKVTPRVRGRPSPAVRQP